MPYKEGAYYKQIIVGLIDAALIIFLAFIILVFRQPSFLYALFEIMNSSLVVFIFFVIYRMLSLLLFQQTIGMKILSVQLLNGRLQSLNSIEKVMAGIFILYKGTDYYEKRPALFTSEDE